jgi:hypothetical protein
MDIKIGTRIQALNTAIGIGISCITPGKIYIVKDVHYSYNNEVISFYFECDKTKDSGSMHPGNINDIKGKTRYLKILTPTLNSKIKIL